MSVAQLVVHLTVNRCALSNGDLFGTSTLSGPLQAQIDSLRRSDSATVRRRFCWTSCGNGSPVERPGHCSEESDGRWSRRGSGVESGPIALAQASQRRPSLHSAVRFHPICPHYFMSALRGQTGVPARHTAKFFPMKKIKLRFEVIAARPMHLHWIGIL